MVGTGKDLAILAVESGVALGPDFQPQSTIHTPKPSRPAFNLGSRKSQHQESSLISPPDSTEASGVELWPQPHTGVLRSSWQKIYTSVAAMISALPSLKSLSRLIFLRKPVLFLARGLHVKSNDSKGRPRSRSLPMKHGEGGTLMPFPRFCVTANEDCPW